MKHTNLVEIKNIFLWGGDGYIARINVTEQYAKA